MKYKWTWWTSIFWNAIFHNIENIRNIEHIKISKYKKYKIWKMDWSGELPHPEMHLSAIYTMWIWETGCMQELWRSSHTTRLRCLLRQLAPAITAARANTSHHGCSRRCPSHHGCSTWPAHLPVEYARLYGRVSISWSGLHMKYINYEHPGNVRKYEIWND